MIRPHRAITQALEQSTLLPFLYHTHTITRHYATASQTTDAASDSQHRPNDRHNGASHARERRQRSGGAPFREWTDFVPFKGSMRPQDAQADFEGSTITPSERKAFAKLFEIERKSEKGDQASRAGGEGPVSNTSRPDKMQKLDDIMDAAGGEETVRNKFPRSLQRMAREAQEQRRRSSKASQRDAIEAAAKEDLAQVAKHFDAARTDVDLWAALQKHVLKRVLALNLDGTPTKRSRKALKQQALEAESTPLGTAATAAKPNSRKQPPITDLDILTLTLPHHLTAFQSILRRSFPASPLPLSLLPHLKTLGPTAFALGTSTELYNRHMQALLRINLDLDGVVDTLKEMDAQVYEYNEHTEDIIAGVLRRSAHAKSGTWGDGVKGLWEGEGMRRKVGRMFAMGKIVRGRREEEALRRFRAEEQVVDEEEGVGGGGSGERVELMR